MKPRGPTILAFVAVLATFALAFAFLGTGTASAAELPLHANAGFVTADGTDLQAQLVTSNTSADPTANLISRDPSGLVVVNPGSEFTGYGSQLHEDQVVFGSNVTISAVTDPNNTTGPAGGLQAVLTNIGINATGTAGMMFAVSLALAVFARFFGKTRISLGNLGRRADHMLSMMGRVTTRAVTSVVRISDGMSRTTISAVNNT